MPTLIQISTGETHVMSVPPHWARGVWEAGDQRFTDQNKTLYKAGPPAITVTKFKLLWQIAELIAIDALIGTDAVVRTFMGLVNDLRTDTVDLALESVQGGIGYTLSKIYPSDAGKQAARLAEILAGAIE